MRLVGRFSLAIWVGGFAAACAKMAPLAPAPVPAPTPIRGRPVEARLARAPLPRANPKLPPVPEVDGPLHITVIYPPEGTLITSRDSNFIFGSVGDGRAGLTVNGTLVPVWPNGAFMGWVANPAADAQEYRLVAYTESDTVRYVHHVRTLPPSQPRHNVTTTVVQPPRSVLLRDDSLNVTPDDTDRAIIGRPEPSGTYRWFLFPGTAGWMTGYLGDMARVRLDEGQSIWVARRDVHVQQDVPMTPLRISRSELLPQRDWIDLHVTVSSPPAYVVDETERGVTLTLYNTTGSGQLPNPADPYLDDVQMQVTPSRVMYTFACSRPVYGYMVLYHEGVMTFRLRRPPRVDPVHPLAGLTIAVDPGHPPIGATGPTGLYEAVATLAVGERVRDMLVARGATVVMTRTTPDPVALGDRPIIARRADANALVSIHLNALPDGMNPFRNNGTGTYYFHVHSRRFASLVQQELVPQLGLRDLGTFRKNLALVRPTWMPAVLTEGVFIIMPDQEAAIRTAQYQEAYACGIVNGVERFFAAFAQ
jgi:N-acetylmuramoyl-L-alanine amidase